MKWIITLVLSCWLTIAVAGGTSESRLSNSVNTGPVSHSDCGDYCGDKPYPPFTCGDYLKLLGRSRPDAEFVDCRPITMYAPKVPGFKATYRIKGKDIERVEAWLMKWAHMGRFKFECCGWDTVPSNYTDKRGMDFEISMFADSQVNGDFISQRKDLAKLPYATLTLIHWRYAP